MENGILNTVIFEILDEIKRQFDFNDYKWAEAAYGDEQYQSRISEIRRKIKDPNYNGRAFTYSKCVLLVNGLSKLIGRDPLEKELEKRLDRINSSKERMILMVLALPEEEEETTEMYLRKSLNKRDKK